MARIATVCLACCLPRIARAEHAPPPRIVLRAAPAPELPAPEYARRPFEVAPELVLGFPSCADGSTYNQRCDGISAGPGLGLAALWRPSAYFAFGGAWAASGFTFHPATASGLNDATASGHFYGVLGRVYFFERGWLEPYLELGLGTGGLSTRASEAGVRFEESSSGPAVRAGGAIELYLGRHVRVGPAFTFTRFNVTRVERCGGSRCVNLDESGYGHGTGFSSLSLRVSILLGPGL